MFSSHRKKAFFEIGTILWIFLLTLSLLLIIGIFSKFMSKAEPAAAESLCESFNIARTKSSYDVAGKKFTMIPNACKTIDKTEGNSLPGSGYPQTKEGVQENIRRDAAKCWDMWLQGTVDNMFDSAVFTRFSNIEQDCFICYTFNIKKGTEKFTGADLDKSFDDSIFFAEDKSDKCRLTDTGYAGGYCRQGPSCLEGEKQASSAKCKAPNPICCVQQDKENECLERGGQCRLACSQDESQYIPPKGWKCADKNNVCCLKKEDVYTYRDYIQKYSGQGRVDIKQGEFCPQGSSCADTYAIVFGARTTTWTWTESPTNINRIIIAPLKDVSNFCFIQSGTTGE